MSISASRGPLSSVISQWAVIGLGGLGLYGNDSVCDSLLNGIQKLLLGSAISSYASNSINGRSHMPQQQQSPPPQSIIIHGGGGGSGSTTYVLAQWTIGLSMGALVIWGSFTVLQNVLPEKLKEMLPVTRHVFDKAITSLGNGIVNVRDVLSRQLLGLEEKQDEFGIKLDETHNEVLGLKDNVQDLNEVLLRCEESLKKGDEKQNFSAKGLRILLKWVGTMLPEHSKFHREIDSLYVSSHDLDLDSNHSNSNGVNVNGNNNKGSTDSSPAPGATLDTIPDMSSSRSPICRHSSADTYLTYDTSTSDVTSRPRDVVEYPNPAEEGNCNNNGTSSTKDFEDVHHMVEVMKNIGVVIKQY